MKLCKDCAHFRPNEAFTDPVESARYAKCVSPNGLTVDKQLEPITGSGARAKRRLEYCTNIRDAGWIESVFSGLCGRPGLWWEPKE